MKLLFLLRQDIAVNKRAPETPMRMKLLAVAICVITGSVATADEYIVDVPQLIGIHGTAPYTTVDVVLQLPTAFLTIDAASLRLTGEHFPGSVVDLISHQGGPIGAVLGFEDSPPGLPSYPFPYFQDELPIDLHEFSIEEVIRAPYEATSDFRDWLDGTAEFRFSVGPPIIGATGAYTAYPLIDIDHAELVISGAAVPEPASIELGMAVAAAVLAANWQRFMKSLG